MKKNNILFLLILITSLLCGCTKQITKEPLYVVTDGVYTMESAETDANFPAITFDTKEKTFTFAYDPFSSYLNVGTYVIEGQEVILTTDDGKYTFTFQILDDTRVSFVEEKSDTTAAVEGIAAVPNEAVFQNDTKSHNP